MNHVSKLAYSNAAIGQEPIILHEIKQQPKNIAIQQRDIFHLKDELAQAMLETISFRKSGTFMEVRSDLQQYFESHLPSCPHLLKDISVQLSLFKEVSAAESFRILFSTISTNMCRRFHTDINSLRLLCTYVGKGTMWLPNEFVNHKAFLNKGGNEEIVTDENQIQQVGAGDVLILKGALYPEANPIVHRSPAIEQHGESRLLLRIDVNDALNF